MKRILSLLLASLLLCALPAAGTLQVFAENAEDILWSFETDVEYTADSVGSYVNWAGVSNVAQFTDAQGRFCFACDGDDAVTVYTTEKGEVVSELQIPKAYSLFGTIVCDADGYLYIVWGEPNAGTDASVDTVFVSKYDGSGQLLQTVGDNGGAIAASIPDSDSFNTRIPFNGGNCDAAINNGVLMVNYARKMYSGHQSNALFAVNTATMEKATSFINYFSAFYNSHSFDQRVTPYGNDGFLLESHGDCYDRTFKTGLADCTQVLNEMNTFDFWVEEGTFDDYNMWQLNRTYARLGNILETSSGAMLVAASARSLSEDAKTEPYDIFVQVFDPTGSGYDASAYVTTGTRSGIAGNNGDTEVTDYGVQWLTDGAQSGKTVDKIQAVSAGSDTVFVLYELYSGSAFDSTWYMILNGDGSVKKEPVSLGSVRLNRDEDPVYTDGAVQWAMNAQDDGKLTVYCLFETAEDKDAFLPAGDPFDINGDRIVNVTDATALLDLLSSTGAPDLNGDHESNVSDVTALLNHLASI